MLRFLSLLALAAVFCQPASAQSRGDIVISTYYECDPVLEAAIDGVMMETVAPMHQQHVASGDLTAWGWNAHVLGGHWRRFLFLIAPDLETALGVRAEILQQVQSEEAAAGRLFNTICPKHEDYIWSIGQTSQAAGPGPEPLPTLTTYYTCEQGSEAEADDAFREVIAPALEDLVRENQLAGWTWLVHESGGPYRRAVVLAGESPESILSAQDALGEALGDVEAASTFLSICASHVDYHWNPVTPD